MRSTELIDTFHKVGIHNISVLESTGNILKVKYDIWVNETTTYRNRIKEWDFDTTQMADEFLVSIQNHGNKPFEKTSEYYHDLQLPQ